MGISKISKIISAGGDRDKYFENPVSDYINLDKQEIRLIKGIKKGAFIRHSPDHYGPKDSFGYVLLNGFNCQARCSYCYLQSYFKSPDMVTFLNFDDFLDFIERFVTAFKKKHPNKMLIFYDGDYKDSLGYYGLQSNITNINRLTNLLDNHENVFLEIRTKNIWDDFTLYDNLHITKNLICAITFGPQELIKKYEIGTSSFGLRKNFAEYLLGRGAKVGARIDPIILSEKNSLQLYIEMFEDLKKYNFYNRGVGLLRLKENLYKIFKKRDFSIIDNLVLDNGFRKYPESMREEIYEKINLVLNGKKLYICMDQ